jgi:hypothetical protein
MCSPHLCKYGDCKAGHSLMTQRNIDYLERRGLAHVEQLDIIALFRTVDENKYVLYLIGIDEFSVRNNQHRIVQNVISVETVNS